MKTSSPSTSPAISPLRAALLLLVAALVALLLGVLVLELVFGRWLRDNPWQRALALNIVTDRRISYDATGLYPGGGVVSYTRDAWGLRGSFQQPSEVSLLTIGGSTTDQRFISDNQTWQAVLQRQLRAAGVAATVANAGVDGHSTFAHLAAYRDWLPLIPQLKPRHTLLYVGLNDLFLASPRTAFEGDAKGTPTLKSRIKANSALFRLYSMARGTLAARRLGIDHRPTDFSTLRYTTTPLLQDHESMSREVTAAYAGRLAALLKAVQAQGSSPVCVTQPSRIYRRSADGRIEGIEQIVPIPGTDAAPVNGVDYHRLRVLQDTAMRAACAAAGAPTIDLAAEEWDDGDFYDLVHNSPRGAQKVGERMARALLPLLR